MINVWDFYTPILIVRGMLQVVMIGILIGEFFNPKRENKFDMAWLLLIMFLFMAFMGINEYVIFTGTIPSILGWIGIAFLIACLGLFTLLIIMRFNFLNKLMLFLTGIPVFAVLVIATMNMYNFIPEFILPMFVIILIVATAASFLYIDFLIKTSGGKK